MNESLNSNKRIPFKISNKGFYKHKQKYSSNIGWKTATHNKFGEINTLKGESNQINQNTLTSFHNFVNEDLVQSQDDELVEI